MPAEQEKMAAGTAKERWKEACGNENEQTEEIQQETDVSHKGKDRIDERKEKNAFPC